ncbi:DMT family transporter [Longirhabdus pacifica]|uniref:DMT family transporter n=1 Tax=Longirhabdus pacifica TaxID=2305227 RepID=UPI00100910F2|nr:DMT family transporter [Longirhabdus pacifica]
MKSTLTTRTNMTLPILSGVLGSIIAGLSFLFLKQVVDAASLLNILAYRFSIAFLFMFVLVLFKVIKVNYRNKRILPLLLASLLQPVLAFTLQLYGMKYATASEAGLITALFPIMVLILSAFLLKEYTSLLQKISILFSVAGVLYIGVMKGVDGEANMIGMTLIVLSTLAMALFSVFARKYSTTFSPMEMTFMMMFVGMLMFNLILFISPEKIDFALATDMSFLGPILYLSIPSTFFTAILTNYSLSKLSASRSGVFMNLTTIVSVLAGVLILHEPFYFYHFIGMLFIIGGVIGVNMPKHKRKQKKEWTEVTPQVYASNGELEVTSSSKK